MFTTLKFRHRPSIVIRVLSLIVLLLAVACVTSPTPETVIPATTGVSQIPPHLSKLVVSIDGSPAADGIEITVWMEGQQVGSATTSGGIAIIRIDGDASFIGKEISFKIGNMDAAEKDAWELGGHVDKEFRISASR